MAYFDAVARAQLAETSSKLEALDPRLFSARARRFERLDLSGKDATEIIDEFAKVINLDGPYANEVRAVIPVSLQTIPAGVPLWRARKLRPHGEKPHLLQITTEHDLREPPAKYATNLRFNLANVPTFYVCVERFDPLFAELQAVAGDVVCIGRFQTADAIALQSIGDERATEGLTNRARYNARLIGRFLKRQLYRQVTKGDLKTYEMTAMIARDYFDLPKGVSDGILYESVALPGFSNAAIRPEVGSAKARFTDALIVRVGIQSSRSTFSPLAYASSETGPGGELRWRTCEDAAWKSMFAGVERLSES